MKKCTLSLMLISMSLTTIMAQWTTEHLSSKRQYICSCKIENKLLFIGGDDGTGPVRTIDVFDVSTNTWTVKSLNQPKMRAHCAVIDNKVYISGSSTVTAESKVLEVFDADINRIDSTLIPNAVSGQMVANGSRLYIAQYGDLDVYDVETKEWTNFEVTPKREAWLPRDNFAMVAVNDKILIAGGEYFGTEYQEVSIFDTSTEEWSTDTLSAIRTGILGLSYGEEAFFIGGDEGSGWVETIDVFNAAQNTWRKDSLPIGGRFDRAGYIYDDKMYIAGGQVIRFSDQFIDRVDVFDFSNNEWSEINLPTGRSSLTMIGDGNRLFFAGGRSDDEDETDIVDIYELNLVNSRELNREIPAVTISPNPAGETIKIDLGEKAGYQPNCRISDVNGNAVLSKNIRETDYLDISNLPAGIYILSLVDPAGTFMTVSKKIAKF